MRREPTRFELAVIAVGGIAIAALSFLPAGEVRVGNADRVIRFTDVLGLGWLVTIACILLAGLAVYEGRVLHRSSTVALSGFVLIGCSIVLAIISIEGVGRMIPRSLLPTTLRRFVVGLGVYPAPWFALAAVALEAMACCGQLSSTIARLERRVDESDRSFLLRGAVILVNLIGIVLIGFGRTVPLAVVTWPGGDVSVDPWALPYLGPGSLILLIVMVLSLTAVITGWKTTAFSTLGAACAWIVAAVSALLVATSGLIARTGMIKWAARRLGESSISESAKISTRSGAFVAFVGGCVAGLAFAAQLRLAEVTE
jgi:hypothetical protein